MIYTSKVEELTNPLTNKSCARLLGRPDKQLFDEVEDNWEQLRKGPKLQTNKVANNQSIY